jgi:hypothetical protein
MQHNVQGLDHSKHYEFWCLILGFFKNWDGSLFVDSTCGFASGIDQCWGTLVMLWNNPLSPRGMSSPLTQTPCIPWWNRPHSPNLQQLASRVNDTKGC